MEKLNLSSLLLRSKSSIIVTLVTVGAVFGGDPYIYFFALALGGMLAWEWSTMVPNKKQSFYAVVYTIAMCVATLKYLSVNLLVVVLVLMILVWIKSKEEKYRKILVLGIPYIAVGIGSLIWLFSSQGSNMLMWFILVVWSVDVGGYLVGCSVRGPKLAPKISPNKTWSGLIGGVLMAVLVGSIYASFFVSSEALVFYALIAAILAVVAQIGDLVESYIKRVLEIKDSSALIPGHGGIFDRIDGMIFSAPFLYLYIVVTGFVFL